MQKLISLIKVIFCKRVNNIVKIVKMVEFKLCWICDGEVNLWQDISFISLNKVFRYSLILGTMWRCYYFGKHLQCFPQS